MEESTLLVLRFITRLNLDEEDATADYVIYLNKLLNCSVRKATKSDLVPTKSIPIM